MTTVQTDVRQGVNSGAAVKVPCRVATTAAITLSGLQTVDGVALADGDRVLVKNQASGVNNGIYVATTSTWNRAVDFDGTFDVKKGTAVVITDGTSYAGDWFVVSSPDPITIGTSAIAFLPNLTGSTGTPISVMDLGATGDGTTDDSDAINAALASGASLVVMPKPSVTYGIASTLIIPQGVTLQGLGQVTITKVASIDMVDMSAASCGMEKITLVGAGATHTGRGIVVSGNSEQYITSVNALNMNGYCLEFEGLESGAKFEALMCEFSRTAAANYAIKMPDAAESGGGRKFMLCNGYGGNSFMEAAGSASTHVLNCSYGTNGVLFTVNTARMLMSGTRAAVTATMAIMGTSHTIVGNSITNNITLDAGLTASTIGPNSIPVANTIIDNSIAATTNINHVFGEEAAFTPVWKGASGDPAIVNGVISGSYYRNDRVVTVGIIVIMGSSTTFGTGLWYFNLPAPLNHGVKANAVGSAYVLDSATGNRTGVCTVQGGSAPAIYCYENNSAVGFNATAPITWAAGDELHLTITYLLG